MKTPWFSKARKPCCGVHYSNICRPWCAPKVVVDTKGADQ